MHKLKRLFCSRGPPAFCERANCAPGSRGSACGATRTGRLCKVAHYLRKARRATKISVCTRARSSFDARSLGAKIWGNNFELPKRLGVCDALTRSTRNVSNTFPTTNSLNRELHPLEAKHYASWLSGCSLRAHRRAQWTVQRERSFVASMFAPEHPLCPPGLSTQSACSRRIVSRQQQRLSARRQRPRQQCLRQRQQSERL